MKKAPIPPPPLLSPSLWSNALRSAYQSNMTLGRAGVRPLESQDHWGPTAEDFSEAVAWVRLLGLTVSVTIGTPGENIFWISRRGCVPWKLDACSPAELIGALKTYAEDNPVPFNSEIDNLLEMIQQAAGVLDANNVPSLDRYLIVHPSMAKYLIG